MKILDSHSFDGLEEELRAVAHKHGVQLLMMAQRDGRTGIGILRPDGSPPVSAAKATETEALWTADCLDKAGLCFIRAAEALREMPTYAAEPEAKETTP